MSDLSEARFHDETAAREYLEASRWPDGPICPHCGEVGKAYATKKPGLYRCASVECRKDFSVTIGTLFERSHIPLHKWLLATHLLMASKKGISAHQLWRMLGFGSYRTAWFMAMRIREALRLMLGNEGGLQRQEQGCRGGRETYVGGKGQRTARTTFRRKRSWCRLSSARAGVRSRHVADVTGKHVARSDGDANR